MQETVRQHAAHSTNQLPRQMTSAATVQYLWQTPTCHRHEVLCFTLAPLASSGFKTMLCLTVSQAVLVKQLPFAGNGNHPCWKTQSLLSPDYWCVGTSQKDVRQKVLTAKIGNNTGQFTRGELTIVYRHVFGVLRDTVETDEHTVETDDPAEYVGWLHVYIPTAGACINNALTALCPLAVFTDWDDDLNAGRG